MTIEKPSVQLDLTEKLYCLTPILGGQFVVCGGASSRLHIWNCDSKCLDRALSPTNELGIRSLCSSDGHRIFLSGGLDGIICIWRWQNCVVAVDL
jgi:WD40 repeat protein